MRMKLIVVMLLAVIMLGIGVDTVMDLTVQAAEAHTEPTGTYIKMKATAYCLNGTTATQTQTRKGICAGKREWFGRYAVVYADNNGEIGNLIGIYRVEDTGGESIRSGRVLDIWMPTEAECFQFGRRDVHVFILEEN